MGAEPPSTNAVEPVVFGSGFEALLAVTRPRLDADAVNQIRAIGIDLDKPFLAAYPVQAGFALMELLVARLYPDEPRVNGYHRLGQDYIRGQRHTLAGRADEAGAGGRPQAAARTHVAQLPLGQQLLSRDRSRS